MCGIIAVIRRPSLRATPTRDDLLPLITGTAAELSNAKLASAEAPLAALAEKLEAADLLLRGTPGVRLLLSDPSLADVVRDELSGVNAKLDDLEAELDAQATVDSNDLETVNARLIRVRDAAWNIERDRLRAATVVSLSLIHI